LEEDPGFRRQRERLRRIHRQLEAVLGEADSALDAVAADDSSASSIGRLNRLRANLDKLVQDYLVQHTTFLDYVHEHARKIEETNRRAAMANRGRTPERNQARIEQLSKDLTRDLRLERIDAAMKELLEFLADADFFAAHASTGRRRRLRTLQNAIDKALQK
jgi:phage shock protein A